MPREDKLTVVMPVFNERATIAAILEKVLAEEAVGEVLVVDDASTDGTRAFLETFRDPRVRVFLHERNQGKGAAIRTAIPHVRGDFVVIQDADLEYDPAEYPRLLAPILEGWADVVYGSRFLGGPHRVLLFWHYVGNKLVTLFSNMLTNLNLTDMETCLKAFRSEVLRGIRIESNRFGFEPEITVKVARGRWRIYEVPISYKGRDYSEGKKITWRDGIAALYWIVRFRFFSRRGPGTGAGRVAGDSGGPADPRPSGGTGSEPTS